MQESETLLGQDEQPGEDVTKKEEETENVPRKAEEERPEKMRAQSTDEQDATSGFDEVRTGRGCAGLVRRERDKRRLTDETSGKGKGKGKRRKKENIEGKQDSVAKELNGIRGVQ